MNSASSAAGLVFDLPLCTHTDTEGKPREARVRNIILRKKTQYLINTLYVKPYLRPDACHLTEEDKLFLKYWKA